MKKLVLRMLDTYACLWADGQTSEVKVTLVYLRLELDMILLVQTGLYQSSINNKLITVETLQLERHNRIDDVKEEQKTIF
jgi:hypothetical protein